MVCSSCGSSNQSQEAWMPTQNIVASWLIPVTDLPPLTMASRKFMYVTPADQYFVLNYDGSAWEQLSGSGSGDDVGGLLNVSVLPLKPTFGATSTVFQVPNAIEKYYLTYNTTIFIRFNVDGTNYDAMVPFDNQQGQTGIILESVRYIWRRSNVGGYWELTLQSTPASDAYTKVASTIYQVTSSNKGTTTFGIYNIHVMTTSTILGSSSFTQPIQA